MKSIKKVKPKNSAIGPWTFLAGVILGSGVLVIVLVLLEVARVGNGWLHNLNFVIIRIVEFSVATVMATIISMTYFLLLVWIIKLLQKGE